MIVIRVRGTAARSVPGATIGIEAEGKAFKLSAVAEQNGTYRGPGLNPGQYRLAVRAQCYKPLDTRFDVGSDQSASITVTLIPETGACKPTEFEFAETDELKAGDVANAVDAAGYSSQAETRSTQLRQALAAVATESRAVGKTKDPAESSLFTQGEKFLLRGDYPQAAGIFQAGTERFPVSEEMLLGLAVSYYAGGHFDQAAKAFCKAVDIDPADRRPYFFLAHTEWSSPAESAPLMQRLAANATRHPHEAAAQYYYAVALWRARTLNPSASNPGQVEQMLRSAIVLDDSLAEAHFELGMVLSAAKEAEAIPEFKRAIDLQPDWAEAHYRLGQLYERTGANKEAQKELAEYERLHQREPVEQERRLRDEMRKLLGNGGSGAALGLAGQDARTAAPR